MCSATLAVRSPCSSFFPPSSLRFLKEHAAAFWQKYSEPSLNAKYYADLAQNLSSDHFGSNSELGVSRESRVIDGQKTSVATPESETLLATGQRLRLLKAGLEIISNHPWWGIGHKEWPTVMQEVTGYPFLSPHNGLLETWGSYGILGALLYIALAIAGARNFAMIEEVKNPMLLWINRGIGLYLLAVVLHELVEVSTYSAQKPQLRYGRGPRWDYKTD